MHTGHHWACTLTTNGFVGLRTSAADTTATTGAVFVAYTTTPEASSPSKIPPAIVHFFFMTTLMPAFTGQATADSRQRPPVPWDEDLHQGIGRPSLRLPHAVASAQIFAGLSDFRA